MITLVEAERIVNELRGLIFDSYEEFVDVFLFYDNEELGSFGGYNAPVIVEKKNGNMTGLNTFAIKYPELLDDNKFIRCGMVA